MNLDIKTRKILLVGCLAFLCLNAAGQNKGPKIAVLARPFPDSVMLRWGPDQAGSWDQLNKVGYLIRRFTILRDGKVLERPEGRLLTNQAVKPKPLNDWRNLADTNQFAAVAAQAVFGADFKVTQQLKSQMGSLINKLMENESRFSFALLAADQSFEVAKMMGLGFVDTFTKANEEYVYRIFPALPDFALKIDTGFVYTGASRRGDLPKPVDVDLQVLEKGVMVSWNPEPFTGIYTTYWVERSEDQGRTFSRITDAPLVNTSNGELHRMSKMDTIAALNRKLIYRVLGVTPFGEIGPSSDPAEIEVKPTLSAVPSITSSRVEGGGVAVTWMIPNGNAPISGFEVERSNLPTSGFRKVNEQLIPANVYQFYDDKPQPVNYYRIRAIGRTGATVSFPVLVQLADSVPPSPPVAIKGQVNKNGIVTLKWDRNTESDLLGYRVFRGNDVTDEFVQVSRKPVTLEVFTDTLEVTTLARKVYYKLVALDKHYNPSHFSQALELLRPDLLPPAPPVFQEVLAKPSGVLLSWIRSSSQDVFRHELLRTEVGTVNWIPLASFSDTTHSYFDRITDPSRSYIYKLKAIDQTGWETDSKPFTSKAINLGLRPKIETLKGFADRENLQIVLQWKYRLPNVKSFLIYKKELGQPLRLFQTVKGDQLHYEDKALLINTRYQYRLKATFYDGTETPFSQVAEVMY